MCRGWGRRLRKMTFQPSKPPKFSGGARRPKIGQNFCRQNQNRPQKWASASGKPFFHDHLSWKFLKNRQKILGKFQEISENFPRIFPEFSKKFPKKIFLEISWKIFAWILEICG